MKGIVLAGGSGTRLYPITKGISKQLLPVYDKPMIYYPVATLMEAGIRDILIISTPRDLPLFHNLLGDGAAFGVRFSYVEQPSPDGLAQAFLLGEEFLGGEPGCLILGDNIFHGSEFVPKLQRAIDNAQTAGRATIFGYQVKDPQRYGVAEIGADGALLSIEEKPSRPKSNYAVVGLYFYPADVVAHAKEITPSARGELEITSLNDAYLRQGRMDIQILGNGFAWLDTGTYQSLSEAGSYIEAIQNRQGIKVACLEEIAYRRGWISREQLQAAAREINNEYGEYLKQLC